jgi:iron-sulfur cluster assembly accessory protein
MALVTLTEPAAAKVKQLLESGAREGRALRLRVAGGGCSGLRYELQFDDQVGELDEEFEQHGVRLLVDTKSALHLAGATLDYNDGLNEAGFKIVNPNANSTCGCGESFSA